MAAELGVDKIFGKGTTPGEVASYLAYALAPGDVAAGARQTPMPWNPRGRRQQSERRMTRSRLGLTVTHRRYVPYSHAHYGGNLVDGAYMLGLFGDVATEVCIRTDGDEGLFASYSDVQFRAPVIAGDVLEVSCDGHPGRHAQPAACRSRRGWSAGRSPSAGRPPRPCWPSRSSR